MKISEISNKYKNRPLNLFILCVFLLTITPASIYLIIPYFSGFGFYTINADYILKLYSLSKYLFIFGLLIPLVILFSSIIVGLNRNLISRLFPHLVSFTIYGLIIYFLLLSFLVLNFIFFFINEILGIRAYFIIICLVITLLFLSVVPSIIKGISFFIKDSYIFVLGTRLNRIDHPKIFKFVEEISKKIKCAPPANIIAGLSTEFYSVSRDIKIFNGKKNEILKKNTMHISLPFLRVLTIDELASIVGHEIGHFEGEDTIYSMKFAPIYRKLNNQLVAFEKEVEESFSHLLGIYPIIFLYNEFTRKEEKISKIQEFKADEFGASAGNKLASIIALAKLYIYGTIWDRTEENHREVIRQNIKSKTDNLSKEFIKTAKNLIDKNKLKEYLEYIWDYQQIHPSDTHPRMIERMKNLNVKAEEITEDKLFNFLPSASSLIPNLEIIEKNLTLILTEIEKYRNS